MQELRYYRFIYPRRISSPHAVNYQVLNKCRGIISAAMLTKPILFELKDFCAESFNLTLPAGLHRFYMLNRARKVVNNQWAYEYLKISVGVPYMLYLPPNKYLDDNLLALGTWAYDDQVASSTTSALEYHWLNHEVYGAKRFKILRLGYPRFRLSPDLYDYVSEVEFFQEEAYRIPLFITAFGIQPKEAYLQLNNQSEHREIALLNRSPFSGMVSSIEVFHASQAVVDNSQKPPKRLAQIYNHLDLNEQVSEIVQTISTEALLAQLADLERSLRLYQGNIQPKNN